MTKTDVLIVGAGPTGLALAFFLAKAGVRPHIIDENSGPGQASRALGVQSRTLEFYRILLDAYEPERIAFARSPVATTDKMFQLIFGSGVGPHLFRETLLPHLAPFALGFSAVRTAAFRLVSQTRISYQGSALSSGTAGSVHGGDRLPWVPAEDGNDNFVPLQSFNWQVHVYGDASPALIETASDLRLALHQFGWTETVKESGLERNALYLVRPDGYVALAESHQDTGKLARFLSQFQLTSGRTT